MHWIGSESVTTSCAIESLRKVRLLERFGIGLLQRHSLDQGLLFKLVYGNQSKFLKAFAPWRLVPSSCMYMRRDISFLLHSPEGSTVCADGWDDAWVDLLALAEELLALAEWWEEAWSTFLYVGRTC